MKPVAFFLLASLFFATTACTEQEEDDELIIICGSPIEIVDNGLVPSGDAYTVVEVTRTGLCLRIEIEATGCSTDNWSATLRTDGAIAESSPTQTAAYLEFDDDVADGEFTCQAQQRRIFDFDLSGYLTGALPTELSLVGTEQTVSLD